MRIFISYSRADEKFARKLATSLSDAGADIWIDMEDIPPGMNWSSAIQQGLDVCDVMLLIITPTSMSSKNVGNEWQYYFDNDKEIIPIRWLPTKTHFQLSRLQYVDFHEQTYENAIEQLIRRLGLRLPSSSIPEAPSISTPPKSAQTFQSRRLMAGGLVGAVAIIAAMIGLVMLLNGGDDGDKQNPTDGGDRAEVALDLTDTPTYTPSPTNRASATNTSVATRSPTDKPTATSTQTSTATSTPPPTDTPSSTPSATSAISPTLPPGFEKVASNAQWVEMGGPIEQEFVGVMMVLVPAGCFDMGSTQEQREYAESLGLAMQDTEDETPVTEICFDEPFWIDKYEVTQGDFARFGGVAANDNFFSGERLPREQITWFEARDFCEEKRGGRLPTEAEWEYAARGPDELIYPWGNEFVADNVVYSGNSNSQTAEVESKSGGVSWAGAYDLSGNAWEWVSSLYLPYDSSEDREDNSNNSIPHVLRGGSWDISGYFVRSAFRSSLFPSYSNNYVGFRCVRFYQF